MEKGIYLAFDISTTCTGLAVFDENGVLIDLKHIIMKVDKGVLPENRYIPKANIFKKYVETYKDLNILGVFIEQPLIRSNNVYTANTLLRFNGICSYLIHSVLNVIPEFITVDEIRRTFCPEMCEFDPKTGKMVLKFKKRNIEPKVYIQNKVSKMYPQLNWFYKKNSQELKPESYDMSDAVAVGLSKMLVNGIIKSLPKMK